MSRWTPDTGWLVTAGPDPAPHAIGGRTPPRALAGRSSLRILVPGYLVSASAGFLGGLNGLIAARTRNGLLAAVGFGLVLVVLAVGSCIVVLGLRKWKAEMRRGYAVRTDVAARHPELWTFDYRTLRPVRAPVLALPAWNADSLDPGDVTPGTGHHESF